MKLNQLDLHNFRRYEQAQFHIHNHFTVLIGNNGKGKTTILDALAIMLNTYFQGARMPTGGGTIKKSDAHFSFNEKGGQLFREAKQEVWLNAKAIIDGAEVDWKRDIGDRGGKAKEFVSKGADSRKLITEGENVDLPLLLYYGAGRLWDKHDDIETEKPQSQLDAYRYCLDPKSDHKAFEKWFKKLSFTKLQKGREIPALNVVENAVMCCVPGAQAFYHDTEYDQLLIKLEHEGIVPFDDLSDGYRNMVGMVADIAHRASRLNPHLGVDAGTQTQGIVLIDEIDLHLHPKWQRQVVMDLKKAFPALQFIASTHSPFILQSLDAGEVIALDQPYDLTKLSVQDDGIAAPAPDGEYSNRPIEDIIEGVMDIDVPQRGERYQKMYEAAQKYYTLLKEAQVADDAGKESLKAKLDELVAPFSDNVAYHAFLAMERLAAGLGPSPKLAGKGSD
jgi:predicted ATP-binding protein involved in virulence